MHHLFDGLVILEWTMGESLIDGIDVLRRLIDGEMAVASGPVRAALSRSAQAHPCAQHDYAKSEYRTGERLAAKDVLTRTHAVMRSSSTG